MGRFRTRGWVVGALIVTAIVVVSVSALVFEGRDEGPSRARAASSSTSSTSTSTSTTTTVSTTTTTAPPPPPTTVPPPPPPTAAPTPVEVVPPPPAPAPACDGAGSGVIDAMNGDRSASGLGGLCASASLNGYAQSWANWMAQNQSLTHQDLGAVLAGTAFSTVGENILTGPGGMSPGDMEAAWMASAGHRQNILNGAYTAAGVGIAFSGDGAVWVAVEFGG